MARVHVFRLGGKQAGEEAIASRPEVRYEVGRDSYDGEGVSDPFQLFL